MIYVAPEKMEQVKYIIDQSILGNHILFETDAIRECFLEESSISAEDAYAMEAHIEKLLLLPSLNEKSEYLKSLDSRTHRKVIRTYFNVIENKLFEMNEMRH